MSLVYVLAQSPWEPVRIETAAHVGELLERWTMQPAHVENVGEADANAIAEAARARLPAGMAWVDRREGQRGHSGGQGILSGGFGWGGSGRGTRGRSWAASESRRGYADCWAFFGRKVIRVTSDAENIAHLAMAKASARELQSYLDRGRRFRAETDEALGAAYLQALVAWASKPPPWEPLDRLHDITAEASIRGLALPEREAKPHLEKIAAMIEAKIAREGFRTGSGGDIEEALQDYYSGGSRRN